MDLQRKVDALLYCCCYTMQNVSMNEGKGVSLNCPNTLPGVIQTFTPDSNRPRWAAWKAEDSLKLNLFSAAVSTRRWSSTGTNLPDKLQAAIHARDTIGLPARRAFFVGWEKLNIVICIFSAKLGQQTCLSYMKTTNSTVHARKRRGNIVNCQHLDFNFISWLVMKDFLLHVQQCVFCCASLRSDTCC